MPPRESPGFRVAWYVAVAAFAVAYLTYNFRLHRADLTAPLTSPEGDSAAFLSLVTAVKEGGWPWRVDRVGAPGVAERLDYPVPEHAQTLALRLILQFTDNPFLAYNLWALSSYPLTAVCAFGVLRALGVSRPVGFAVAVLFTFLPYHASRAFTLLGHLHTVPLVALPILWIVQGRLPFFGPADENSRRRRSLLNATTGWTILIAVLVAATSAYYAFFGCFFLTVAGMYRAFADRSVRPLLAGLATAAVIVATGFACTLPFVIYHREHGENPAVGHRSPNEAEVYCLKLTQLVLPAETHRVNELGHITRTYNADAPLANENKDSTLGLIGVGGFLVLLGRLLVPAQSARNGESGLAEPDARRDDAGSGPPLPASGRGVRGERSSAGVPETPPPGPLPEAGRGRTAEDGLPLRAGPSLLGGLAILTVAAVLLGVSGGFGSLFNFAVFPQIRAYNRVCVFVAFWSLLAVAVLVDRWTGRWAWPASIVLLVVGLWDMTSLHQAPKHAELQRQHEAWRDFVDRMESALPAGGMVFQLPAVSYPEAGRVHQMPDYAHLACHSYSRTLRWSYGTNRNRRWAEWHEYVASLPPAEMVRALVTAGFAGVYVDRRGYADSAPVLADLEAILGPAVAVSESGDQSLFSLARIPVGSDNERDRLLNRPCVLVQAGFLPWTGSNPRCALHTAELRVVNPDDRTRRMHLSMGLRRLGPTDVRATFTGVGVSYAARPPIDGGRFHLDLDVPPGEHVLRIEATPAPPWPARLYPAWEATDIRLWDLEGGRP